MEYAREMDITKEDNEYATGSDGNNEPLAEGNDNDDGNYASVACCTESIIL